MSICKNKKCLEKLANYWQEQLKKFTEEEKPGPSQE